MFGRVTFDGPTSMTIKIRARDGNTWGPWSPPSGLYCREVTRVASITTSRGQIINEGDSFTFDVAFDKPMQLDTDLTLRLTRSKGSYPKFRGGIGERTITVRRGQSEVSLDMRSIDDDIWSEDPEITLEIVPGTGYRAGHRNAVSFQILDGSYGPELDADGNPTGNIVFNGEADTVTRSFPRCGEGSVATDSVATDRIGLVEVREDAGTIQVPVHTIAGGIDFDYSYLLVNFEGTATRENDYNAPFAVAFQPFAETTLIDIEIVNSPLLEDAESFGLSLWRSALTEAQHLFDCQYVEIIIEDDDTADTTIRIADGADAAFTDFVGREARVTEGNTIKLQVSLPAETGDCIVPFRINVWTTASGDVAVIDQIGFTTNNGTRSGLSIPPCTASDEMQVPTFATAGDQGTKTVYFDIAPFDDERVFLEGGRETVRYTVHIDDSEAGSQQVETDTTVDETPPQLQSATVDGSSLTLAYDETLDSVAVPNSAFTVNVNGSPRPVLVAAVAQSNVLLHLSEPVEAGDAVTVDYTVPTGEEAGRVQDSSGNAAGSFSGQAVTNDTTSSGGGGGGGGARSDEQDPPGVAAALLTATTHDLPASHDGSTIFTFELRFSETPGKGFSYKTLRDNAFTVTGGEVVKARRLEKGRNVRWEISVRPDGNGAVTTVLPATTDCTAQGAICTQDGRMLSNRLEITVPGPGG